MAAGINSSIMKSTIIIIQEIVGQYYYDFDVLIT